MNRIDRLTAIILMLQNHRVVTAEAIAERFEISVRTVYRDLTALGEAGVPIMAEAGVGYSLMRGYHVPPIMFTEEEAAALFLSGELVERFGDDSLNQSLQGALAKVRAALPEEKKDYWNRLGNVVSVWSRPGSEEDHGLLMAIQEAVVRRRCLAIAYETGGRGEITERIVEALGVVFYSRHWHLLAWCRLREEVRDFRVDRIRSLSVLEEIHQGHEDFSVMDFLSCETELATEEVTLDCDRAVVEKVLAEGPLELVNKSELPDRRVRIVGRVYSLEWTAHWVIGVATAVEVRAPDELRAKVKGLAEAVLDRYRA